MSKLFDVTVTTGSYEVNGEKKYRSLNVGSVWEGKNGPYLRMSRSFNPAGVPVQDPAADTIICNMWEPRARDTQSDTKPTATQGAKSSSVDFDDEVPF